MEKITVRRYVPFKFQLLLVQLPHAFLYGALRNQPVHVDGLVLAHPVASVLGLLVIVRVEVDIVDYDGIRCGQVDSEAPGSRRQQEHENALVLRVLVNKLLPVMQKQKNSTSFLKIRFSTDFFYKCGPFVVPKVSPLIP